MTAMPTIPPSRPLGRVLRAGEAGLCRNAEEILAAAVAAAQEIRAAAKAEADDQRAAMAAEAQAEQARVHAAALAEGKQAASRILVQVVAALRREIDAVPAALAEAIAQGVVKVIGSLEVGTAVACAAAQALAELAERTGIIVRVAPGYADTVRAQLLAQGWDEARLRVLAEPTLEPRDCIVETRAGYIKAGLDQQLAALRDALHAEAARPIPTATVQLGPLSEQAAAHRAAAPAP